MQLTAQFNGRSSVWPRVPCGWRYSPCLRSGLRCQRVTARAIFTEAELASTTRKDGSQQAQLDFTNITRHNFKASLPHIRAAIQEATFIAIDAEFTGLHTESPAAEDLDDYEERYKRVLASSDSFNICQFGLSAFKWHPSPGFPGGGFWEARTFNAYVFPRPDDSVGWDDRFMCQASSLAYLASQGFDFNRMIHDGVSYLPLDIRDNRMRLLTGEAKTQQKDMEVRSPEEQAYVDKVRGIVLAWLLGSEPELRLSLPRETRMRALFRQWVQAEFQLPSLGYDPFSLKIVKIKLADGAAGEQELSENEESLDGEESADGEGAEASNLNDGAGDSSSRSSSSGERSAGVQYVAHLQRVERWRAADMAGPGIQLTARQRMELLADQTGFSLVFEALRSAPCPIVGHNPTLDLAYMLAQFGGSLPGTWALYKAQLQRTFPMGLYDTKYLAQQLVAAQTVASMDTALGSLYRMLMDDKWLGVNVRNWAGKYGRGVEIRHAPGHNGYDGVGDKSHEAGYDALMTASVFTRLLSVMGLRSSLPSATAPAVAASGTEAAADPSEAQAEPRAAGVDVHPVLRAVLPHRGKLHVRSSDLPCIDVYGTDPVPNRPAMLHVSGFTPNTRWAYLAQRFQNSGLGLVQVLMQTGPNGAAVGALVLLSKASLVPKALQIAREKWSAWKVVTYRDYHSARQEGSSEGVTQQRQPGATAAATLSRTRKAPGVVSPSKASSMQQEGQRGSMDQAALKAYKERVAASVTRVFQAGADKHSAGTTSASSDSAAGPASPEADRAETSGGRSSAGASRSDEGVEQATAPDGTSLSANREESIGAGVTHDGKGTSTSAFAGAAETPPPASEVSAPASLTASEIERMRAAERLERIALAAQRLKGWKESEERVRPAAGGMTLQRPGRPGPKV